MGRSRSGSVDCRRLWSSVLPESRCETDVEESDGKAGRTARRFHNTHPCARRRLLLGPAREDRSVPQRLALGGRDPAFQVMGSSIAAGFVCGSPDKLRVKIPDPPAFSNQILSVPDRFLNWNNLISSNVTQLLHYAGGPLNLYQVGCGIRSNPKMDWPRAG